MPLATAPKAESRVEGVEVSAFRVPTDGPESDGTLEWDSTTIVTVLLATDGEFGVGYTYSDASVADLIASTLAPIVEESDPRSPPAIWAEMHAALRNAGQAGPGAMALSAVDVALWDLKARLLGIPLADALPRFHERVPVYASGGFTSYSNDRLAAQVSAWASDGHRRVKIKVGRDPAADRARLRIARDAVGPNGELMVDANGAYERKEALAWAELFGEAGVTWLEEPVSSDDAAGLRLIRDRAPAGLAIAAGEYIWGLPDAQRLLEAKAVDVLQADVTRCGGITGLLRIDGLCRAFGVPFSAHCAPSISAHACCAMESMLHAEFFHDHARVERLLFDGTLDPVAGTLEPDRARPGLGIDLRDSAASEFAVR